MRNFKKVIAAGLALLMLALSVNVSFAAENYSAKEAEAVGKVNAAGIMTGTDKGFEPSKSLTRAEAAAIIVRMKGISESAVKASAGTTLFNDVAASHWASGYVNQASNLGIVKGVSATTFAPDREVTIAEFVTMAVRALGAGQLVDAEGTWPTNYINFANENKLLDDVNAIYTATATRLQAATIVANALYAPLWEKTGVKSNGEITWGKAAVDGVYKTLLNSVLKLRQNTVTINSTNKVNLKDQTVGTIDVLDRVDLTELKSGVTYQYFMNEDGDYTGFWIEDDTIEFTAVAADWSTKNSSIKLTIDGKDKEYKLASATLKYSYNEAEPTAQITTLTKNKDFFGTITLNDDNKISSMQVYCYDQYALVDDVTASTVKFVDDTKVNVATAYTQEIDQIKFNKEDNAYVLTKDGKAIKFSDLEEDDVIRFYTVEAYDGTANHIKYVGEVVKGIEGKVSALAKDGKSFDIEDEKYDIVTGVTCPSLKDEVIVYTNKAGKAVLIDTVDKKDNEDLAIISYIKPVTDKYGADNWEVKLFMMDGNETEYLTVDLEKTFDEAADVSKTDNVKKVTEIAAAAAAETYKLDGEYNETGAAKLTGTYYQVKANEYWTVKEDAGREIVKSKMALNAIVNYKVNGDKLTVCFDKTATLAENATQVIVGKRDTYLADNSKKALYFFTDDTVVYNVKEDKTYRSKVEKVAIDTLADQTFENAIYLIGFDADDKSKSVDYVILADETVKRSSETNFAVVTKTKDIEYNDKDALKVYVTYLDGSEGILTYAPEEAYEDDLELEVGYVYDLSVADKLIMDAKQPNKDEDRLTKVDLATKGSYFVEDVVGSRIILTDKDNTTAKKQEFFLDEDVLVLGEDDGKYTVLDLDAIHDVDFDADEFAQGFDPTIKDYTEDKLVSVWTYEDEDGTSVIAIIFNTAESRN